MSKDYSPNVVASSFIKQYYEMMTKSPENLHKFYNENSYFLHSDLAHPSGVSATGPEPIRAAINALNLKYTKVDLTNGYVDAQKSANNGVFVLVVGTLAPPDAPDKPFVQTFLLSNQASSAYYVSNSVFRLLVPGGEQASDSVLVQLAPSSAAAAPASAPVQEASAPVASPTSIAAAAPTTIQESAPVPAASPVHHEEAIAASAGDASANHIEAVEALLQEEKETDKSETEVPAASPAPAAELPAAPTSAATPAPVVPAAPVAPVDPNRKLNYSDIVRKANSDASAPAPAPAAARTHHHAVPSAPAPAAAHKPAAAAPGASGQSNHSVYVKQLPDAATQGELANLFGQFGTVMGVDQAAGRSFAFVKFDSAAAVQAAVAGAAGGKLTLHGQALRVEERNSTRSAGASSSGAGGSGTGTSGGAGRGNRDRSDGRREGGDRDHRRGDGDRRASDRERGDRREGAGRSGAGAGARSAGSKPASAAATKAN